MSAPRDPLAARVDPIYDAALPIADARMLDPRQPGTWLCRCGAMWLGEAMGYPQDLRDHALFRVSGGEDGSAHDPGLARFRPDRAALAPRPPETADALGNDKGPVYAAARRIESILDEAVLSGALTPTERAMFGIVAVLPETADAGAPDAHEPWTYWRKQLAERHVDPDLQWRDAEVMVVVRNLVEAHDRRTEGAS